MPWAAAHSRTAAGLGPARGTGRFWFRADAERSTLTRRPCSAKSVKAFRRVPAFFLLVDFVTRPVQPENDGLGGLPAVKIVDQSHGCLIRHSFLPISFEVTTSLRSAVSASGSTRIVIQSRCSPDRLGSPTKCPRHPLRNALQSRLLSASLRQPMAWVGRFTTGGTADRERRLSSATA
jgi:hypothetical protein